MASRQAAAHETRPVQITLGEIVLHADLTRPDDARGLVLFAHGSGSSRSSPRNRAVAATLSAGGFATLLLDLLTEEEERVDDVTGELRFDIPLLTRRLEGATRWAAEVDELRALPVGYFGASTGAAAALGAAARLGERVGAVVSRGGRPDLAGDVLPAVTAPTLLIVGGNDREVLELNELARDRMRAEVVIEIVPGATHLFEEPGALERVAELALRWFELHLAGDRTARG